MGDLDIRSRGGFQAAALHQTDSSIGDRFSRQAMGRAGIEAEHAAGQMERADLAPSVVEELVGANRAADHLIDIFGRLALTVDFLVLPVGKLAGNHTRAGRDHAELVDGRNSLGARGGENLGGRDCRGGDRLGEHFAISWMRDGFGVTGILAARYFGRYPKGEPLRGFTELTRAAYRLRSERSRSGCPRGWASKAPGARRPSSLWPRCSRPDSL